MPSVLKHISSLSVCHRVTSVLQLKAWKLQNRQVFLTNWSEKFLQFGLICLSYIFQASIMFIQLQSLDLKSQVSDPSFPDMDLRGRFSFNHYRKRICRVKFLIEHFRIWIYDCGFHSIISRRWFAECEFQSSLGLGLDFEPGFASRVWTWPHNRPIQVYVSDPRPILVVTKQLCTPKN